MVKRFRLVATGGTFDEIHAGHIALLAKAFEVGEKVIIGVSSDDFAARRNKKLKHDYETRVTRLTQVIAREFGDVEYELARLDADFGPAVTSGDVSALVASTETKGRGRRLNEIRASRGLKPVKVIEVKMIKAEDGVPISSTRIRSGEIDRDGRLIRPNRRS